MCDETRGVQAQAGEEEVAVIGGMMESAARSEATTLVFWSRVGLGTGLHHGPRCILVRTCSHWSSILLSYMSFFSTWFICQGSLLYRIEVHPTPWDIQLRA